MSVTLLVPETSTMEDRRRLQEQDGHRRWHMRMNVRERTEDSATTDPSTEYAVENGIAEHPLLNTQRFDGIAPDSCRAEAVAQRLHGASDEGGGGGNNEQGQALRKHHTERQQPEQQQ